MKKYREKRAKMLMILALGVILIAGIMAFFTAPITAFQVTTAMALVVGSVTLEGKEEAIYKALQETIQKQAEKFEKDYISEQKMLDTIAEKIKSFKLNLEDDETFKKLNATLEAQGLELKAMKEVTAKQTYKTVQQQIEDHLKGKSLMDAMKEAPGNKLKLTLKAGTPPPPPEFLTTDNITNGKVIFGPTFDPGWDRAPSAARSIRLFSNVTSTNSSLHVWIEKVTAGSPAIEFDADYVEEGELKPYGELELVEKSKRADKIAVVAKVSNETLQDIPSFMGELRTEIFEAIGKKEEDFLLNGDTGASINGVIDIAAAFVATGISTGHPNDYDALRAAAGQLKTLNYTPNVVFVNPVDKTNMDITKGTTGHYVLPPFLAADGTRIDNIAVIESNFIDAGYFLMGDFTKFNIRDYIELEVTLGWENDDFTRNMVTVIGEKRLIMYVKAHQQAGFIYDTFVNVKTAIDDGSGSGSGSGSGT